MGIERYLKMADGFRKYVELLETIPTSKRETLLTSAREENPEFAETVEKYVITFERIARLPETELAEILQSPSLKSQVIAIGIASVTDQAQKDKLLKTLPRTLLPQVNRDLTDNPTPSASDITGARLKWIMAARELEKQKKLPSIQMPLFNEGHFKKKAD